MSYQTTVEAAGGGAEQAFREAFERLKRGVSITLPKGAPVTQNNVAREAGRDPTALRKTRYPSLVREIQQWVSDHANGGPDTGAQSTKKVKARNRDLREKLVAFKAQRDAALALLVQADARILELTMQLERFGPHASSTNVTPITSAPRPSPGKSRKR